MGEFVPTVLGSTRIYIVDTSAIIDMNRWYPPDAFEDIWRRIEAMIGNGEILAPMEVLRELERKDDTIKKWCQDHKRLFVEENREIIKNLVRVKEKYSSDYWEMNINSEVWADPWVVALALSIEIVIGEGREYATIVTSENKYKPNRIPAIAREFGIRSLNVPEFMSEMRASLPLH